MRLDKCGVNGVVPRLAILTSTNCVPTSGFEQALGNSRASYIGEATVMIPNQTRNRSPKNGDTKSSGCSILARTRRFCCSPQPVCP